MKQTTLNFGRASNGVKEEEEPEERVANSDIDDDDSSAPSTPPKPSANGNLLLSDSEESELTDDEEVSILTNPRPKADPNSSSSSKLQSSNHASASTSKKNLVGDVSTSTSASGDNSNGQIKKRSAHGESEVCHAHHLKCGDLIRCTYLTGQNSKRRCPLKWCAKSIEQYGSTVAKVKSVMRVGVSPSVREAHSPEESFVFKCPRCQDACVCARCRRAKGLEPIQRQMAAQAHQNKAVGQSSNGTKTNQKSNTATSASASSSSSKPGPSSNPAAASSSSAPKPKFQQQPLKGFAAGRDAGSGPMSAPRSASTSNKASTSKKSPGKFRVVIPVKRPPDLPAPDLEKIQTSLPQENLFARAYIYETLNRFTLMKVPRSVVAKLDRFDQWTNKDVQGILERIILLLSALDKLESGSPVPHLVPLVRAWRKSGKDLSRGETWKEALALAVEMDVPIYNLPPVDHDEDDEEEEEEVKIQPISSRLTRRRAAAAGGRNGYKDDISSEDSESESSADSSDEDGDSDQSTDAQGRRRSTRTKAAPVKSVGNDSSASASASRKAEAAEAKEKKKEAAKIPAPPFEEKIETLVAMLDLVLATQNVADDLKEASESLNALEKAKREATKARDHEFHTQISNHDGKNPGPFTGEPYREWQKVRNEMKQKKIEEDRDAEMRHKLEVDALRIRSGPLGKDVDGNEYWQLSQSDKSMPSQTQGRYAWSLLVLGKPYISPLSLKPTSASDPILIDDDDDEEEEDEDQKKKQVAKLSLKRANGSSSPSKDIDDDTSLSSAQSEDEFYDASEDAGHQSKKAKVETNGETSAVGTKEQNGTDKGKTKESNSGVKPQGKSLYGTNFPKEINQVIAFIRYRHHLKDYNEWVQFAKGSNPTKAANDQLQVNQDNRKKQIDHLIENLKQVREYYIWQTGEEVAQAENGESQ